MFTHPHQQRIAKVLESLDADLLKQHNCLFAGGTAIALGYGEYREDDMAAASIYVMNLNEESYHANTQPMLSHINVGTGIDCTIRELVETVAKVVGYQGEIVFDTTKPDGVPRKLMDVSRLADSGWKASIELESGLATTYQWFLDNQDSFRG